MVEQPYWARIVCDFDEAVRSDLFSRFHDAEVDDASRALATEARMLG